MIIKIPQLHKSTDRSHSELPEYIPHREIMEHDNFKDMLDEEMIKIEKRHENQI